MDYGRNKCQPCLHKSVQSTTAISVPVAEKVTSLTTCPYTVLEYVQVNFVLISVMIPEEFLEDFLAFWGSWPVGESQPYQLILQPRAIWSVICKIACMQCNVFYNKVKLYSEHRWTAFHLPVSLAPLVLVISRDVCCCLLKNRFLIRSWRLNARWVAVMLARIREGVSQGGSWKYMYMYFF